MIEINEVVRYLNLYSKSALHVAQLKSISEMLNLPATDPNKAICTRDLIDKAKVALDPCAKAELLVYCGVLCFQLGWLRDAEQWMNEANKLYDKDIHRQAVTEWLLFIFCDQQVYKAEATLHARKAWKNLRVCVKYSGEQKDKDTPKWYQQRIYELVKDVFSSPRYVYESMFEIQGSSMSRATAIIKGKVEAFLKAGKLYEACKMMENMQSVAFRSFDRKEIAEVMAYCGVVNTEMPDYDAAVQSFNRALAMYMPKCHESVMVMWMRSLSYLKDPRLQCASVAEMQECIRMTETYATSADRDDKPSNRDWYQSVLEAMKRVQKQTVENGF